MPSRKGTNLFLFLINALLLLSCSSNPGAERGTGDEGTDPGDSGGGPTGDPDGDVDRNTDADTDEDADSAASIGARGRAAGRDTAAGGDSAGGADSGDSAGTPSPGDSADTGSPEGQERCEESADCDELASGQGPCVRATCTSTGRCLLEPRPDGTPCEQDVLCESKSCRAGSCVADSTETSSGRRLASAFAWGSARDERVAASGGLATILSDERVVYADSLDGTGTLLSAVRVGEEGLRLEAQWLTSAAMHKLPVSPWIWQSIWTTHLVRLSATRFALVDGTDGIQTFEVSDSGLQRLDRLWLEKQVTIDAVATDDGRIWVSQLGIQVVEVDSAGKLRQDTDLGASLPGANRLVLGDDGWVYGAGLSSGVFRWRVEGDAVVQEALFPDAQAYNLAVSRGHLAVQLAEPSGAFGDVQLYRLADRELIASWTETLDETPVGAVLVGEELGLTWQRRAPDRSSFAMILEVTPVSGAGQVYTRTLRERGLVEEWSADLARSNARAGRTLLQPWRTLFEGPEPQGAWRPRTGPGNGTMAQVQGVAPDQAVILSPDSSHRLRIEDGSMQFVEGGMFADGSTRRFELLLSPPLGALGSFEPRPPVHHTDQPEELGLWWPSVDGPRRVGAVSVDPGWFLQRGAELLMLRRLDASTARLRRVTFTPLVPGGAEVAREESTAGADRGVDISEAATTDLPLRAVDPDSVEERVLIDFDPRTEEFVVVTCGGDAGAVPTATLTWGQLSGSGEWRWLVEEALSTCPKAIAVRDAHLATLGESGFETWSLNPTTLVLEPRTSQRGAPWDEIDRILGVAGRELYAGARIGGQNAGLVVLDIGSGRVRSQQALPEAAIAMSQVERRLAVLTKASAHLFEPLCEDFEPAQFERWPVPDADERPPQPGGECQSLPECVDWAESAVPGDVNRDGCVDAADGDIIVRCFGDAVDRCTESILADIDGNGVVDDYVWFVEHVGEGCAAP